MKPIPTVKRKPTRTYPPPRKTLPLSEQLPIVVHRAGTSFKDEDAGVVQNYWSGFRVTWTSGETSMVRLHNGWFYESGTLHLLVPHRRLSRPAVARFMAKHGIKEHA